MTYRNKGLKMPTSASILSSFSDKELLHELSTRKSIVSVLGKAGKLFLEKSADYNSDPDYGLKKYFPFGPLSYAQMIHTKSMRISSIAKKMDNGSNPNFESLSDSALDMICYAMFLADYCDSNETQTTNKPDKELLLS